MNLSIKYTFTIGFQRKYQVRDHPAQIEYEILELQVLFSLNSLSGIHSTPSIHLSRFLLRSIKELITSMTTNYNYYSKNKSWFPGALCRLSL